MENDENKMIDQVNPIDTIYNVGDEGKDINGEECDSSMFNFVQQDKNIHDVKFTTKPTTFLKDAIKRFRKSRSSVVGGVILGILFLLAIILPVSISYDITKTNTYETNLPMKLLPAGSGFWDGTQVFKNYTYPYEVDDDGEPIVDDDGNYVYALSSTYPDPNCIINVKNVNKQVMNHAEEGAHGGFVSLKLNPSTETSRGTFYNCGYTGYDFTANKYTLTYSLGTVEEDDFTTNASYALYLFEVNNSGSLTNYKQLTEFTTDYGEKSNDPIAGGSVTERKFITYSLNDLITNNSINASSLTGKNLAFGFVFSADQTKNAYLNVKSFRITGKTNSGADFKTSVQSALNARSFGSNDDFSAADATIVDANTVVLQKKEISTGVSNPSYWANSVQAVGEYKANDTFVIRADVTIDMYLVKYGLKDGIQVDQSVLEGWKNKGLVEYESLDALITNPDSYKITETGENDDSVYVTKIISVSNSGTLDTGEKVYSIFTQVTVYKMLGYKSMPIHIFGTEKDGKDMLKYVFSGLRTSLILGVVVSLINIVIGIIWGSISGYYGGAVDITMERITDILGGIPYIVLMTILTIQLGSTFFVFALSLCLTGWIGTASTTRSQFYRYRGREYVLAAKTLGAKPPRLIFRHILPNAVGTIVTRSILMIPSTIFSEATISYLGLGLKNLDSLGIILSETQNNLALYPYQLVIPAIIISLLMICFNLFGNGLRDAFNPSLKGTE